MVRRSSYEPWLPAEKCVGLLGEMRNAERAVDACFLSGDFECADFLDDDISCLDAERVVAGVDNSTDDWRRGHHFDLDIDDPLADHAKELLSMDLAYW